MEYWLIILCQLIPTLFVFYFYLKHKYSYWSKLGVKGPPPSLLTFGNVLQIYGANPSKIELELLNKYGKVYGNYTGLQPTLTLIDNQLIKQVLVKDFHLFMNRRILKTYHEFMNLNQFFTEGAHWKRVRTITGPTFTSGKLRGMHLMMDKCIDKLTDYMNRLISEGNGVLNTKEVIAGFTIDVISSTAFATDTNANDDRKKPNPLVTNGMNLFEVSPLRPLSYFAMPRWFNDLVKVKHFLNVEAFEFFAGFTGEILRQRKSGTVSKRNDLVQLLMDSYAYDNELKDSNYDQLAANDDKYDSVKENLKTKSNQNSGKIKLTDKEIIAQCIVFFIAGYETTAVTMTNVMYEMANNQDIQERLVQELEQSLHGMVVHSEQYYETVISQVPYLDAVIKETLRKYPPILRLERRLIANKCKVAGIELSKDQLIEIPVYAVHHNPEYYPHPEVFNPERFMPENKHLLLPYTYLPFGAGPRNCIGMRFAYQEIKLCIAKMLPNFRFTALPQTPKKLQFQPFKPTLSVNPFQLRVEKR